MTRAKSEKTTPEKQELWIIDAVEDAPGGPVARLERPDGNTQDVPLSQLPGGLQEGDILRVQIGPAGLKAEVLPRETAQAGARAQAKLNALNAAGQTPPEQEINL